MIRCQICEMGVAKVHITQMKNGKKNSFHLCLPCAEEHGLAGPGISMNIPLVEFATEEGLDHDDNPLSDTMLVCSGCGVTLRSFRETGRLGCPECYQTFEHYLMPLLEKLHQTKLLEDEEFIPMFPPEPMPVDEHIEQLQEQLQAAIKQEDFQEAARLRDEIRALKSDETKETE